MTEVIDLAAERNRREQPDAEHIIRDDLGVPLYRFLLSYEMDGSRWSAEVWAYSFEDAIRRVAAMRASLNVDGQCFSRIDA